MVKLAQHIEWSSPLPSKAPSKAGEDTEKKTSDHVLADGKPRKTLAQLFESRTASLSSKSPASSTLPLSSEAASAASAAIATPLSVRTASSLSTSSSASSATAVTPSQLKAASPVPSSAPLRQSARTPFLSSANAHVTFCEDGSAKYHKHAHTTAANQISEISGSIKRSSSARKIADSSRHEGVILRSGNAVKGSSISGPLDPSKVSPRNLLTNARNSEPGRWNDSAKLSSGDNGRPNKTSPQKLPFGQEKVHLSSAVSLTKLEPKTRSPFAKFRIYEHNHISLLQKSVDMVETLQNGSKFRPKRTDPYTDKGSNAEYTVRNTLLKETKVRKGLFGLLTDASMGKDLARESKVEDVVSGNVEKMANAYRSGGENQDEIRPQIRTANNELAQTNQIAVSLPTDEYAGRKIPGNLSMLEESRESSYAAVEIPDKMVGLAWIGVEPRFLKPGSHSFPSDKFLLEEVVSDRTRYLKHGFLHRVYIEEGHLGVAWVDGKAILLEAGVSVHISPSNKFSFTTTDEKMLSEKEFVLGPFRIVTVDESEVGIKFCNRLPHILHPGRHCLSISKVEVFAGFESLLRRQSYVNEAHAISRDDMKVSADAWLEWQIKVEDAAAARLANITDVEGAVCCKVRRAFNLVVWEVNVRRDINFQPEAGVRSMNISDSQLIKSLSSSVLRECQELFEEGWTVTIWDLQLKHILIQSEVQGIDGNDLT